MEKNINLLKLKDKYYQGDNDIKYCYDFLDKLTEEIKKKSNQKKKFLSTYVDYKTGIEYSLNVTVINKILSYCYNQFFFKPLFMRNKKIREFHEVFCDYDSDFLDIFIKSLVSNVKAIKDSQFRSLSCSICETSREQFRYYKYWRTKKSLDYNQKSIQLLKEFKDRDYIRYEIPISFNDDSIEDIFPLSCNTFFFCNLFYSKGITYRREKQFFFLENFLENSLDSDPFNYHKLDICVQSMILISFKNLGYQRIDHDDNSFTKK